MSNSFTHDAAISNRRRLIRGASLDNQPLFQTILIRSGFLLRDIKNNLIDVSHSNTKLMTTLAAGALLGFAIAAGAFNLKNGANELAALEESSQLMVADSNSVNEYEHQLSSMLSRSTSSLKAAEHRLDAARKSDPTLFNKCLAQQSSTLECKSMKKIITVAQKEIETATSIINYVENNAESAVSTGATFTLNFYNKSEAARQQIVNINKKFSSVSPDGKSIGIFGNTKFEDPSASM